ncbi:hypothetical protein AMAG_07107 [Allomyces macrogynus ATCC 38327]|uniref:Uncharacterized protein n=1 Tax=Allomyces macrogynus (strain ATCC 38327) TaxID=578462 RepID=A0A0L0SHH6_ALLM3|nr:hypothetical protein AMAG_07107 [Allomyces macrogynus ATCC 38327]|eukprot:KNE61830.1 hypothetical protein AMAG_07107 [Allomyces macrogynus ATCC 38327]
MGELATWEDRIYAHPSGSLHFLQPRRYSGHFCTCCDAIHAGACPCPVRTHPNTTRTRSGLARTHPVAAQCPCKPTNAQHPALPRAVAQPGIISTPRSLAIDGWIAADLVMTEVARRCGSLGPFCGRNRGTGRVPGRGNCTLHVVSVIAAEALRGRGRGRGSAGLPAAAQRLGHGHSHGRGRTRARAGLVWPAVGRGHGHGSAGPVLCAVGRDRAHRSAGPHEAGSVPNRAHAGRAVVVVARAVAVARAVVATSGHVGRRIGHGLEPQVVTVTHAVAVDPRRQCCGATILAVVRPLLHLKPSWSSP